jgi:hypothetical protein
LKFLLHTNVISELSRDEPDMHVFSWMKAVADDDVAMSAMSVTGMRYGIELLPHGRRKANMGAWLADTLTSRFFGRILPMNQEVADQAGVFLAMVRSKGLTIDVPDVLIAATASIHSLILVTRNTKHFVPLGVQLYDPWH